MGFPSVTYTFTNGTTSDATQVNTNFTDLVNALSDGTKDISFNAGTFAGTLTANGSVNLGNAVADDLTISAALASSIPIKTTNSYDIGSATLGLRALYWGGTGSNTTKLQGAAVGSSITLTLPATVGSARDVLQSDGAGALSFVPLTSSSTDLQNISITTAVAASALTITIKGADGNDLSATNAAFINFKNATTTTGTPVTRTLTANPALTISSGSTLGHASGATHYIYLYLCDDSGTVRVGASSSLFDSGTLQTITAEGGAGAADSSGLLYASAGAAGVPIRLIGRLKVSEATAGTWASNASEISLVPFQKQATYLEAYRNTTNQTIATGVGTGVIFNTEVEDTLNGYDNATGIFTAPFAGFMHVHANILWAVDAGAAGIRQINVTIGGSTKFTGGKLVEKDASNTERVSVHGIQRVAKGDTVQIFALQTSGGNLDITAGQTDSWLRILLYPEIL